MTIFEIIIIIALYSFSFSYMVSSFGLSDEHNTWKDVLLIVLVAGTIGIIQFPMIFAEDIWNKLNADTSSNI